MHDRLNNAALNNINKRKSLSTAKRRMKKSCNIIALASQLNDALILHYAGAFGNVMNEKSFWWWCKFEFCLLHKTPQLPTAAACVAVIVLHGKMSLLFMQKINVVYNASGMVWVAWWWHCLHWSLMNRKMLLMKCKPKFL